MIGRALVAGTAIVAALTLTGCGGDDGGTNSTTTKKPTTSQTTGGQAAPLPVPTPADLNAQLGRVLDPAVPAAEKQKWVQGLEADPSLIDKFGTAVKQNNVLINVTKTEWVPAQKEMWATADFTLNGQKQPDPIVVPFVPEGEQWKLKKTWICERLPLFQITSPACP